MTALNIINGLQDQWQILDKLGEGDAGEIFRVEALRARKTAVLKRPLQDSMPAEIARQAGQISVEGRILKSLANLSVPSGKVNVHIARLLDESLPGNELTNRAFIVVEEARGTSLAALARLAHFGPEPRISMQGLMQPFFDSVGASGRLPDLLLLRAAWAMFSLLETIHTHATRWIDTESYGILWNDVKPAHLFWDPTELRFWVIDWGNAQFLDAEGESSDRLYSTVSDYQQFIEEMGRFLTENAPALQAELEWPAIKNPELEGQIELADLRRKLNECLDEALGQLAELRGRELYLCGLSQPNEDTLNELVEVQKGILLCGEMPDYTRAASLRARHASSLLHEGNLHSFWEAARLISSLPGAESGKWKTLALAAGEVLPETDPKEIWQTALQAGIDNDWTEALWEFGRLTKNDPDLVRWKRISSDLRKMLPEVNTGAPTPLMAMNRLVQILDDVKLNLATSQVTEADSTEETVDPLGMFSNLLGRLKNVVVKKWSQLEPTPPASDVTYSALDELFNEFKEIQSQLGVELAGQISAAQRSLTQARAQAEIFQDAWQGRGFKTARQSLRHLLLWDPDRRRVLQADLAVELAPTWLEELHAGPQKGERLTDFAIRIEFQGRDLRAKVAPARWLEIGLALLSNLRNGRRPADLVEENPDLTIDYPWLRKYRRRQPLTVSSNIGPAVRSDATARPLKPGKLGQDCDLLLAEALDNWVPEARGSSARVFLGYLNGRSGGMKQAAIKLMRQDKADYALPLFWEEVQVLSAMQDVPGVMKWFECGFLQLDGAHELPHETSPISGHGLTGDLLRAEPDNAGVFLAELEARVEEGWIPYLALEKKNSQDNLLALCDAGFTQGQFLPLDQALLIAVQLCEILQSAHERRVVYRDHKILHYYWNSITQRVTAIDWNISRLHPEGLPEGEVHSDLVQFGARGLHHLFTGRPAPGALPVGPTQPQEIEAAPQTYTTSWTYDDQQRLPHEVRQIIANVLTGLYNSAERLKEDLLAQTPA